MNRENKKKTFEKSYYKTHPCMDTFTCKACGWPVGPEGAGSGHRNHCPNCLTSLHLDVEPGDRAFYYNGSALSDCTYGYVGGIYGSIREKCAGVWFRHQRCRCCEAVE